MNPIIIAIKVTNINIFIPRWINPLFTFLGLKNEKADITVAGIAPRGMMVTKYPQPQPP